MASSPGFRPTTHPIPPAGPNCLPAESGAIRSTHLDLAKNACAEIRARANVEHPLTGVLGATSVPSRKRLVLKEFHKGASYYDSIKKREGQSKGWKVLVFLRPETVIAWRRREFREHWRKLSRSGRPGRPRGNCAVRVFGKDTYRSSNSSIRLAFCTALPAWQLLK